MCAFPPLRDKVVLNIMDGLRGQYDRGPVPAPQFVWPLERLYVASDPVAMDSVGFDVLLAKQIEAGRLPADKAERGQEEALRAGRGGEPGTGVHRDGPIETRTVVLG